MAKRKNAAEVGRRGFLKGATLAGAATLATPLRATAQSQAPPAEAAPKAQVTAVRKAAETGAVDPSAQLTQSSSGSDFMVDVIKSLGIEYIAATTGSSLRALQESIVNYGENSAPEFITTLHEENSVSMSNGYAKVEGKPMMNTVHAVVGLQHASMAIYNAYCDRAPVLVVTANAADATMRRPGVEWTHTVQDGPAITRDFTKWDDAPASLQHFAESGVRAYKIAVTPPMGPIVLVADSDLQESPIPDGEPLVIPKLPRMAVAQGDDAAVGEVAKMLVDAAAPVLIADRGVPGPHGVLDPLVELAELLQCSVVDAGSRMNFPSMHPLNQSFRGRGVIAQADLVIGLDMFDFWGQVHAYRDQLHRTSRSILKPGTKTVSITAGDQVVRANFQDFERFPEVAKLGPAIKRAVAVVKKGEPALIDVVAQGR